MLKGGLPPTIVIAMYQSDLVTGVSQNYGFLSAIIAVVAQCLLPRARFTKIVIYSLTALCASASLCCLGVYCAVKARDHTAAPGEPPGTYNSSACAVAAIWLLFSIWLVNSIRAYRPIELQAPASTFSMFIAITMTRAGIISSVSSGLAGIRRLLLSFLIGFSISTGVSLFILPTTSRSTFFHTIQGYPAIVKEILDAQIAFVKCSEDEGPWQVTRRATVARMRSNPFSQLQEHEEAKKGKKEDSLSESESKAKQLKDAIQKLSSIHSAARAELYFAKQEIAWGRLTAEDFESLFALLRSILLPLSGIAMLPDVFRKLTKTVEAADAAEVPMHGCGYQPVVGGRLPLMTNTSQYEMPEITEHFVQPLCDRLETAADLVKAGFQHAFVALRLTNLPKRREASSYPQDEEAPEDKTTPGSPHFAAEFERKLDDYFALRKHLPEKWASLTAFAPFHARGSIAQEPRTIQKEFFVLLFISHLQDVLLQAVLELVYFADSKVANGTMNSKRLLFPKREHIKQWFFSSDPEEKDNNNEDDHARKEKQTTGNRPFKGRDPLKSRYPDPEHMPPANTWQRIGSGIRAISHFLSSEQSSFGVRVAIAAFCAVILAYLRQTQTFFFQTRVIWVVIVILIGMNPTSGNSLFGLMGRFVATVLATILALVVWYIVDGRTAGVIVMTYIANCLQYYPYLKNPRFIPASIIGVITFNLIIAFELLSRKLGVEKVESSGLPYYPVYLFGPYRCVAVITACAISYFWVVFPSPTSAGSRVRKTLGRSLFVLANFYSCMHTSIEVWINQEQGDTDDSQSPGRLLDRARIKLLAEEMALLKTLRVFSDFTRYEPPVGGRFPKETYDNIISAIQTILTSMDLMALATRNLERMAGHGSIAGSSADDQLPDARRCRSGSAASVHHVAEGEKWIRNLAQAANSPEFRSGVITSVLYHLSAAVTNSLCLPPYLAPPHPFPLARRLRRMNEDLLKFKNVENPSFAAIIAIEVLSSMVSSNLKTLMRNLASDVKQLVGELNFDVFLPPPAPRYVNPVAYAAGTSNGLPVPITEVINVIKHPEGGCPLQVGEGTYELRDDVHLATPPPHPSEPPLINPNPLATGPTPPTIGVKLSLATFKPRRNGAQLYKTNTRSSVTSDLRSVNESDSGGRPSTEPHANGTQAPPFGEGSLAVASNGGKDTSGSKRRKPKNNILKSGSSFVSRVIIQDVMLKKLAERSHDSPLVFANLNRSFQWLDYSSPTKQDFLAKILFTRAHILSHDVNQVTKSINHIDLAMGSSAGDILWYEPVSQKYSRINKNGTIRNSPVNHIKWIPGSENLFLAAHSDGCLVVYDKEKDDSPFTPEDSENSLPSVDEQGEGNSYSSLFKILKSVNSRNQRTNPVSVWKLSNQKINNFAFSPDRRHLAVVLEDGTLRILDYLKEKLLDLYTSYYGGLICVCWSPDGKYILTGGQDDLVSIWSFPERKIIARCQGHNSWVSCVEFDPWRCDDRTYRFGSVGDDCRLLLWDFSIAMLHRPKAIQVTARRRNSLHSPDSLATRHIRSDSLRPEKSADEKDQTSIIHPVEQRARTAQLPPIMSKEIGSDPICWLGFLEDSIMTSSLEGHIRTWDRPSEPPSEPNASAAGSSLAVGSLPRSMDGPHDS
ncbi:hypothetical protein FQN49_005673 [Arthroderma sp. PD_2]|nr:hypothetical protein FQN49_005673 [Arthroderma sp. PD_2]